MLKESIKDCVQALCKRSVSSVLNATGGGREGGNYVNPPPPNGKIASSVRLACAIRYFSGGPQGDILSTYKISQTEVMFSVWGIVEAVNQHRAFHTSYPEDHEKQRIIVCEFCAASGIGFKNCAGAIDGLLIWILKPSEKEARRADILRRKLFCARKGKFGLNMQAVSDKHGRILDMSIDYGGASSDCLAFEASDLYQHLENGLLANGLVLFGDNAYLNTQYMATPFPNVTSGSEDTYNFYHSQVRSTIFAALCFVSSTSSSLSCYCLSVNQ